MRIIHSKVGGGKVDIIVKLYHSFEWIYSFYREYIGRVLGYIIVELIHMAVNFIIAYRIGSIVDYAVEKNTKKIVIIGLVYVGLYFLNAALTITANRYAAWNYNSMQTKIVKVLYNKIIKADWEEISHFHSGDLMTRLTDDSRVISGNANGFLTTVISDILMILVALTVIIMNDVSMILVASIVAPVVLISSRIFMNKIYESQSAIKNIDSKESAYHKESFQNIQAIKAFGLAHVFYDKIEKLEDERFKADMRSNFYALMSWGVTYLGGILSGITCIAWAFYRVNIGVMTLGELTVVIMMLYRIAISGKNLLELIPISLKIVVSVERIQEILSVPDEECFTSSHVESFIEDGKKAGISLILKDISFAYKAGRNILDNVSLKVNAGEIIALVGPSGEGKTTMLRILLGILNADSGNAYALIQDNEDRRIKLSTETRALMAYVPQGNTMLAGTIAENMRLIAPDATEEEIIDALQQSCAYDFVKKLPNGIHYNIGESGTGFSEGQNQRLAIARAILRKTPILLMDEATSALDVVTEKKILSNLMKKDIRRTCILTTHRPSVLTACDRVYRICNGNVDIVGEADIQKLINEF